MMIKHFIFNSICRIFCHILVVYLISMLIKYLQFKKILDETIPDDNPSPYDDPKMFIKPQFLIFIMLLHIEKDIHVEYYNIFRLFNILFLIYFFVNTYYDNF